MSIIHKYKLLKKYFDVLNENMILAGNVEDKKMRNNYLKYNNTNFHVNQTIPKFLESI